MLVKFNDLAMDHGSLGRRQSCSATPNVKKHIVSTGKTRCNDSLTGKTVKSITQEITEEEDGTKKEYELLVKQKLND